jgi:hypothetical protein
VLEQNGAAITRGAVSVRAMDGIAWPSPTVGACTLLAGSALDAVGLEVVDAEDGRWVQTRTQRS